MLNDQGQRYISVKTPTVLPPAARGADLSQFESFLKAAKRHGVSTSRAIHFWMREKDGAALKKGRKLPTNSPVGKSKETVHGFQDDGSTILSRVYRFMQDGDIHTARQVSDCLGIDLGAASNALSNLRSNYGLTERVGRKGPTHLWKIAE